MTKRKNDRHTSLAAIRKDIRAAANPAKAKVLSRFFKTGKGEYGEGDVFLGLTVPVSRGIVVRHDSLPLADLDTLLHSKMHEERLIALLLLVRRFQRGTPAERNAAYDFYMANAERVNNWDLVDTSAPHILGEWLLDRSTTEARLTLVSLAQSSSVWSRRIAIVATLSFIRVGEFSHTFEVTDLLLSDDHDLLHKACGWMLREVGKKDKKALVAFLKIHYASMPRTMLRYAIERFPEAERKRYLSGRV